MSIETKTFELWVKKDKRKIGVEAKRISVHEWRSLCPFHNDVKHPNLDINDIKKVYYCFACGAKGHLFEPGFTNEKRPIQEIYNYDNEKGELRHQVVKYKVADSDKALKFKQRRPDGKGGWIWNLKGVKRVIYNLPEVIEKSGKPIFIFEGEKDCNNLTEIGILTTTNSGGAGKWRAEYNRYFKDRDVILSPDNDEVGLKHMQEVGKNLKGIAKSIKWLILPGLKKGEDVSDWIEQGGDLEKLFELVKSCQEFIPLPEEEKESMGIREEYFRITDLRNSDNFSIKYKKQLIYCQPWNNWLIYSEGKWKIESRRETQELAKKVIMDYYKEASEILEDKARLNLIKEAMKCESQRAIRAMIELATSSIAKVPEDFDQDPYILNFKNGTMDLKTMGWRDHKAEDMLTKITNISLKPKEECPKWAAFLDKIFEGNKNLIDYLQTALGYSLTGDIGEQCMFILYGIGANGKSTFINVIYHLLGDYAINSPFSTFLNKGKGADNIPNDLARLRGARFVTAIEAPGERRFNEALLKTITGTDPITARFLRQEYFDFYPECKIWLATNHKPIVREFSLGFWRKIRLIPFTVTIPEEERILHYDNILLEEKEGIFNWVLEGYMKWKEEKLKTPEEIEEATAEYKSSMDVLAEFIEQCCIESHRAQIATKELYKVYKNWCDENDEKPVVKRSFGRQLAERGYKSIYISRGERGWGGIALKDKTPDLPFDKN